MAFADKGHRDHARHTGETPITEIDRGPHGLKVTLDQWGPWNEQIMNIYLQSNWGEHPMAYTESAIEAQRHGGTLPVVDACLSGHTLAQILEGVKFWFTIDGVCRPATHQIVRTRDAAYMQHGGRDNDWRHRRFSMPETIHRICELERLMAERRHTWENLRGKERADGKLKAYNDCLAITGALCITDPTSYDDYLSEMITGYAERPMSGHDLRDTIENYLAHGKKLYSALVDSGVPWQDARRLLPMGLQTYIHAIYDFRTLQHTLANRLEHIMDWEYNCVGQLMVRQLYIHCPRKVADCFKSTSDRLRKAAFAGLESWPPDGKYPVSINDQQIPRAHRPEQNPFFVLTDDSLHGGPVEWIATDGTYPHDNPKAPKAK